MTLKTNLDHFRAAQTAIPGGVNSPVRAFTQVGGDPFFVARAQGPYLFDVEGNRYVDYIGSWGPMIAGHAHPAIVKAVIEAARDGMSFGAPSPLEYELAAEIKKLVPSIDLLRMVSSGTEACMSAIRLARGYTGRDLILKFDGCYHGHGDSFLVKAGSGVATLGLPNSPGVPKVLADLTLSVEFNAIDQVEAVFAEFGDRLAAVIVEPVAGNMNCVLPSPEFLPALRRLCDASGAVLIFDEVMTGFRIALGGAQAYFGVTPDLSCYGKVIGAGMPVGAYGGKRAIMEQVAPLGPVYQAGTLSGNPVAMAAGLANIKLIQEQDFFPKLTELATTLTAALESAAVKADVPLATCVIGGMFGVYFAPQVARNYREAQGSDINRFKRFFHASLRRGIFWAPSAYEAGFISITHAGEALDYTLAALPEILVETR